MSNLYPVFLNTPDALQWVKGKDFSCLILVAMEGDAVRFIKHLVPYPVPVWKVEMRIAYLDPMSQAKGVAMLKRLGVHPEPHDPSEAWDAGKWEIGFEAYVGGDRRMEYPDEKKWKMLKP